MQIYARGLIAQYQTITQECAALHSDNDKLRSANQGAEALRRSLTQQVRLIPAFSLTLERSSAQGRRCINALQPMPLLAAASSVLVCWPSPLTHAAGVSCMCALWSGVPGCMAVVCLCRPSAGPKTVQQKRPGCCDGAVMQHEKWLQGSQATWLAAGMLAMAQPYCSMLGQCTARIFSGMSKPQAWVAHAGQ